MFLAANQNGQGKTPFSWRLGQTAKERHRFLGCWDKQPRKHTFSLAANKNSQENILFWLFVVTAKETLYSLAAELRLPRKIGAAKVNLDWCSVLGKITSTEDQNVWSFKIYCSNQHYWKPITDPNICNSHPSIQCFHKN